MAFPHVQAEGHLRLVPIIRHILHIDLENHFIREILNSHRGAPFTCAGSAADRIYEANLDNSDPKG